MPFLILTVEAALRSMDGRYEEAAANLGARRWTTFRRVTLPMIGPSLVAGAALAWGARPGGVRRHHHVCRRHTRADTDGASRRLPGLAGQRAGRRSRSRSRCSPSASWSWSRCVDAGWVRSPREPRRRGLHHRRSICRASAPPGGRRRGGRGSGAQRQRQVDPPAGTRRAVPPFAGRIQLDGVVLDDPGARVLISPERGRVPCRSRTTSSSPT